MTIEERIEIRLTREEIAAALQWRSEELGRCAVRSPDLMPEDHLRNIEMVRRHADRVAYIAEMLL